MLAKIENTLLAIAGICIIALGLLITATVLLRSFVGWGIPDDVVIVKELMIATIILPCAAVSAARAPIAIEFLYNRFNRKTQAVLLAFSSLIALLTLLPIVYAAWRELAHVIGVGSYFFGDLSLPKWPGRLAFFVGIAVFALRMAVLFVEDFKAVLASDAPPKADGTDGGGA